MLTNAFSILKYVDKQPCALSYICDNLLLIARFSDQLISIGKIKIVQYSSTYLWKIWVAINAVGAAAASEFELNMNHMYDIFLGNKLY